MPRSSPARPPEAARPGRLTRVMYLLYLLTPPATLVVGLVVALLRR